MKYLSLFSIFCSMILGLSCSDFTTVGTGSSTETSLVSGKVFLSDGETPAAGVTVRITTDAFTSITTADPGLKSDSVTTDEKGTFSFDTSLNTGTYVIEAIDGNMAAVIKPVTVSKKDTAIVLAAVTLQPTGGICGTIHLPGGDDPTNVYILISGINRFTTVNADGSFLVLQLGEGTYDLRILPAISGYDLRDVTSISVSSGDTTCLEPVTLPFSGIPAPIVSITADSIAQNFNLSWKSTGSSHTYNVYRIQIDPEAPDFYLTAPFLTETFYGGAPDPVFDKPTETYWRLNATPVTDTFFIDADVRNFNRYAYRISAVDSDGNESGSQISIPVEIPYPFMPFKTIFPTGSSTTDGRIALTVDKIDYIILFDIRRSVIMKYSPEGEFISEWTAQGEESELSYMSTIHLDSAGNHYLSNWLYSTVLKYDPTGNPLPTISFGDKFLHSMCIDNTGRIYCLLGAGTKNYFLACHSTDGELIFESELDFVPHSSPNSSSIACKNGTIFLTGETDIDASDNNNVQLFRFDTTGKMLSSIPIRQQNETGAIAIRHIAIANNGDILLCDRYNTIRIFNQDFTFRSLLDFNQTTRDEGLLSAEFLSDGAIVASIRRKFYLPGDIITHEVGIIQILR